MMRLENSDGRTVAVMKNRSTKTERTVIAGVLQTLAGCILFCLFGVGALVSKIWSVFAGTQGTSSLVLFLIGTAGGLFLIWKGVENFRLASGFRKISRIMGESKSVQLSALEKKLEWNRSKLLKTLRRQMAKGFWQDAHLDAASGVFMLEYIPPCVFTDSGIQAVDELLNTANGFIHEMATASISMEDTALKAQVEHLIGIATQIYAFVKKDPGKTRQVRQFSNYYLPITAGLLKNYQELSAETVKGENIRESMRKIADAMATVETAFENHLNDLYQDKNLDISVDVEVLQNMINEQKPI